MSIILIVLLIVLIICSIIDIKYQEFPSIFPTGILFVFAFVNIQNLSFGILAFVMAYLLYESDFIGGLADIKLLTTIGFLINSLWLVILFIIITLWTGFLYKLIIKRITQKKKYAFIPCITIIYAILLYFM